MHLLCQHCLLLLSETVQSELIHFVYLLTRNETVILFNMNGKKSNFFLKYVLLKKNSI